MDNKQKRHVILLVILALMILASSIALAATFGTIHTKGTLNIREGANTASKIIGNCDDNTRVEIIGETRNWYKILVNGMEGYIYKDFVEDVSSSQVGSGNAVFIPSGRETTTGSDSTVEDDNIYNDDPIPVTPTGTTVPLASEEPSPSPSPEGTSPAL